MRTWLALLLALACIVLSAPVAAQSLTVEVLQTEGDLDTPPITPPVLERLMAATPDEAVHLSLPRRQSTYWLRLTTDRTIEAREGLVLVLRGPPAIGPVTYWPPGVGERVINDAEHGGPPLMRRGWVLPLPDGWPASNVVYLRVNGEVADPLKLSFSTVPEIARTERGEARFQVAAFTAMMLMAVTMVGIWIVFRDMVYLGYGAYLACAGMYLLLMSGDASEMWGLSQLASGRVMIPWVVATLATIFQIGFSLRFLDLQRLMPRTAWTVRAIQWANLAWLAVLLIGREHVYGWWYIGGNLLLLLGIPLMLVIALIAWRKGAPYAGYYLLGWTPLLTLTAMIAANTLGLQTSDWAERGLTLTAVLESGVLALALSQHAANRHRILLLAQQSAERDLLTGALNGNALRQMLEAWSSPGSLNVNRYGLLLLDLDGFSAINAQHGRAVGDALLQQVLGRIRSVLRPDDTVARISADCFGVVAESERTDCEQLARRMAEVVVERPFLIDGHAIAASASIGLAMSQRGEPVSHLFERVTQALRSASAAGRNAVSVAQSTDRPREAAPRVRRAQAD